MNNKLYRDTQNEVIGGVCGGLGKYFDIDPVFIRILFLLWVVFGSFGFITYVILWIAMPSK